MNPWLIFYPGVTAGGLGMLLTLGLCAAAARGDKQWERP